MPFPALAAMLPSLISAGGAVAGGLLGSSALSDSGDFARKMGRAGLETQRQTLSDQMKSFAPYQNIGQDVFLNMLGYEPVSGTTGAAGGGGVAGGDGTTPLLTIPNYKGYRNEGDPYQFQYAKTGEGVDPTGGAGTFLDQLQSLGSDFQFNENDPAYQYKLEQSNKNINQQLAARGMYNSRPGLNLLDESSRAIMSNEYDKQYNRKYGSLMDLFNMSTKLGGINYGQNLDAVNIGLGATGQASNTALAGAQGTQSGYTNMANLALQQGQNKADLYSGLGAMPLNFMVLQQMLGGNQPQSTLTQGSGASSYLGDMWAGFSG